MGAEGRKGGPMRTIAIITLILLTGCAEYRAYLAAEDDAKCKSYGAKEGEPAYVACRASMDAARTQADAIVSHPR